jgi:hypothetical protein
MQPSQLDALSSRFQEGRGPTVIQTLTLTFITLVSYAASFGTEGSRQVLRAEHAGLYTWGHEVNVFQPCTSDSTFWVVGERSVLEQLRLVHDSLTEQPYEAVYIRVLGQRTDEEPDGFAEHYDGLFRVDSVLELRRVEPSECE